eukprot:8962005-Karenia_brevis.AAC.1
MWISSSSGAGSHPRGALLHLGYEGGMAKYRRTINPNKELETVLASYRMAHLLPVRGGRSQFALR